MSDHRIPAPAPGSIPGFSTFGPPQEVSEHPAYARIGQQHRYSSSVDSSPSTNSPLPNYNQPISRSTSTSTDHASWPPTNQALDVSDFYDSPPPQAPMTMGSDIHRRSPYIDAAYPGDPLQAHTGEYSQTLQATGRGRDESSRESGSRGDLAAWMNPRGPILPRLAQFGSISTNMSPSGTPAGSPRSSTTTTTNTTASRSPAQPINGPFISTSGRNSIHGLPGLHVPPLVMDDFPLSSSSSSSSSRPPILRRSYSSPQGVGRHQSMKSSQYASVNEVEEELYAASATTRAQDIPPRSSGSLGNIVSPL